MKNALMFYQLPPAGNPISLSKQSGAALSIIFSQNSYLYASGTAALAAAIGAAIKLKHIKKAEVILPAYACPDLVSAIIYAGAKPVLVDLESERPWLDLSQLEAAINSNTVAVVAVNLFGIAERWSQLAGLTKQHDIVLIEDSAQYFPGADEAQKWHGDLVVLSFARGKPVSLLGGGAVITEHDHLYEILPKPKKVKQGVNHRFIFALKAMLYNLMISPFAYWVPQSLPFLHLGETRYHALKEIEAISRAAEEMLPANIARYQHDALSVKRCESLSAILCDDERLLDLPRLCGMPFNRRLLRYPVLVAIEKEKREEIIHRFQRAGLGVSRMYPAILPEIEGCEGMFSATDFPNAKSFASRILTLPTHAKVTDADIKKMHVLFSECLNE